MLECPEFADLDSDVAMVKVLGSIVAIEPSQMPDSFVHIDKVALQPLLWQPALLPGFAVAGELPAAMDRLGGGF